MDVMEIRRSPRTLAMGSELESEVEGVIDLLTKLSQGIGPRLKDIPDYSPFFQLVMKQVENFYHLDLLPPGGEAPSTPGRGAQRLYGADAVSAQFMRLQAMFESFDGAGVNMSELQPLKAYGWLLTGPQVAQVQEWIGLVTARMLGKGCGNAAVADIPASAGAIVVAQDTTGGFGASGASSSSASASSQTKKALAQDERAAEGRTNMLRFFLGGQTPK